VNLSPPSIAWIGPRQAKPFPRPAPSAYGHNLQVCLDREGVATIYLLSSDVDPDPECALLGKRRQAPEPADDEPDP
jgi:hypothetical protein